MKYISSKKLLLLLLSQIIMVITAGAEKPRYIWIDACANFVEFADSKDSIVRDLQKAYDAGFTDIIVDVRSEMGDVLYNTTYVDQVTKLPTWAGGTYHYHERTATWDYLQAFIDAGHDIGLKVHAGFNTFVGGRLNSAELGAQGLVFRDPSKRDWVTTLYRDGSLINTLDDDSYSAKFLNPANDEVQDFLLNLIADLAKYDLDGIFLDRCRYDNEYSDFSDVSKEKFEEYLGTSISDFPACISSTYQKQWWAFRAKVIYDFIVKARKTVKSVNSDIQFGTYVGAWYSSYYEVGVNWASASYDATADYSDWASTEWNKYGYADHLDFMLLGAYAPAAEVYGEGEWTHQGFCKLADKKVGDLQFAAGPDVGNPSGFENGDQATVVTNTIDACMNVADGYFLFDMVHVRDFDYWEACKKGFTKYDNSTPSDPYIHASSYSVDLSCAMGQTATKTITVDGNLLNRWTYVTLTCPEEGIFTVTPKGLNVSGSTHDFDPQNPTITITFSPSKAGSWGGDINGDGTVDYYITLSSLDTNGKEVTQKIALYGTADDTETDYWNITTKNAGNAFTPTATYKFYDYNGHWLLNYGDYTVAKQFAVSNGVIYTIVPGYTVTNKNSEVHQSITATSSYNNGTHSFATSQGLDTGCEQWYTGQGIAADDSGNLIYAYASNYCNKVDSIAVIKSSGEYGKIADASTRKGVVTFKYIYTHELKAANASTANGRTHGRTDFFYASGNCYDGTGYVWFTDGVKVVRITIQNVGGQQWATKQDVYPITGTGFVTPNDDKYEYCQSRIKPYGNNCFLLQNETGVYDCRLIDGEMVVESVIRGEDYLYHAGNIVNFNGHKILVLDANRDATRDGQLNIYDMNTDDITSAEGASIGRYINAMTGTYSSDGSDNRVNFPTQDHNEVTLQPKDLANVDTWCEFEIDPNGTQLYLYTYCQGVGYAKFTINSGKVAEINPVATVTASLEQSVDNQYQNANISWDVSDVTDHSSTQYKIYYRTKPFLYGEEGKKRVKTDEYSEWQELGTTEAGATTYIHEDVKYLNYGTEFYERTYEYKVLPVVEGKNYQCNSLTATVTPEWLATNPIWSSYHGNDGVGVVEYSGYKTTQLFWSYGGEGGKGNRPTSYDIYRNDIKIATTSMHNYVDYEVAENKEHDYYIVAHFKGMSDAETKSTTKTITVGTKDSTKPQYKIEEVYNYRIGTGDGEVNPQPNYSNFTDPYYYRQGAYFRGDWYIAQRANGDGGNGGIIKFYARGANEKYIEDDSSIHPGTNILNEGNSVKYEDFSFNSGTNVGLSIDDYGNIFVRYADDEYSNELTQGHILRAFYSYSLGSDWETGMTLDNTANGALLKGHTNYEALTPIEWVSYDGVTNTPIASIPAYVFDFSSLKFTDLNTGETLTGIPGRCDYYFIEGNVFSEDLKNNNIETDDDGAILYVSPSGSKTIYRIRLNTSAVDGEMTATGIDAYTITDTSTGTEELPVENGNYAFNVDGRQDYIFNLSTNGYFNIGVTEDNPNGKHIPIVETHSGMDNAGGCTIQFNGELYMIYPHSYYSTNTGDFSVGIADRREFDENGNESYGDTNGADLYNLIPIATFNQESISDAPSQNVNGQWLFAELGLLDGTPLWIGKKFNVTTINEETGEEETTTTYLSEENISQYAECIYIHQYVPGVRFAKYRLTIPQVFPPAETRLSVYPVYTDADGGELTREGDIEQGVVPDSAIEIDRLDGRFEWDFITYNNSTGVNVYVLEGYHLTITDQYGDLYVYSDGANEYTLDEIYYYATGEKYDVTYTDANGNVVTKTYKKGVDADFQEYMEEVSGDGSSSHVGVLKLTDLYSNNDKIYSATMVVDYVCTTGSIKGDHFLSAETRVENDNGFEPVAPTGEAVVYRSIQWSDWDADGVGKPSFDGNGNPVLPDRADAYWDVYKVSMNINEPEFDTGKEEPVSYYTIHVAKTDDGTNYADKYEANDTIKSDYIKDIMLYIGKDATFDGVSADDNGYIDCGALYGGKIPGNFEFKTIQDTPKDYPDIYWFEKFYMGYYNEEGTDYEIKTPDKVDSRKYYIVAHYAAGTPKKVTEIVLMSVSDDDGNGKIYAQRHAELSVQVETENLPTGVENIELTANVSVYPIPATVSVTIKCAETLESVGVYTLAGVKVKELDGNNGQVMTVAVDDLETGYYMLRVNDYAPIKFLKK